jgi:hypothetical protein
VLGELIGMRVLPVLVPGLILGYLLPLFTAAWRGHRNCFAIGALNLLAGWTVVGWVVAMVWACTADVERS